MRLLLTPEQVQVLRNESGRPNAHAFIQTDGERLTVIGGVVLGIPAYLDADGNVVTFDDAGEPSAPITHLAFDHDFSEAAVALLVSRSATRAAVVGDTPLDDVATGAFAAWFAGLPVLADDVFAYDERLWRVVQAHTTQADWEPPTVPALWTLYREPGTVQAWVQPTGAHDAYALGDRVTHAGQTWESTVSDNVWEPGAPGTEGLWTVV